MSTRFGVGDLAVARFTDPHLPEESRVLYGEIGKAQTGDWLHLDGKVLTTDDGTELREWISDFRVIDSRADACEKSEDPRLPTFIQQERYEAQIAAKDAVIVALATELTNLRAVTA